MSFNHQYDKNDLKNSLSMGDIASIVSLFGAEPIEREEALVMRTICHNDFGEGSHKLYYYDNTKLFICYTQCAEQTFDIYELIIKVKLIQEGVIWQLPQAMKFVAEFFGVKNIHIQTPTATLNNEEKLKDWEYFEKRNKIQKPILDMEEVELEDYDPDALKFYPRPLVLDWIAEGITKEVCDFYDIAYNPLTGGVLIPHYDINHRLVGIRERALVKEVQERYGKYLPSRFGGLHFKHPLGLNLYGLDQSKENIKKGKVAIVAEGEKSILQYASFFGSENSIACATCGSSLSNYQFFLLKELGAEEIVIAFDKDFEKSGDENFHKVVQKLTNINQKYGTLLKISFMFDKEHLLGYKNSPFDKGKDIFLELFKNRIVL